MSGTGQRLADSAILALTAVAGFLVAFDWDVPGRTFAGLVLVLISPGWTLLRLGHAPMELFTVLLASALSIAYAMLLSLVLTTRLGWAWQSSAVITSAICVVGLVVASLRQPSIEDTDGSDVGSTPNRRRIPSAGEVARSAVRRYRYGAIGVPIAAAAIVNTDLDAVGPWGMIQAVPPYFYIGTALIIIGVLDNLRSRPSSSVSTAWAHMVALVVVFHGAVAFTQPNPRFPVAWLHVAFADHLADGGRLLQFADARFSWPGFFTAAGYLQRVTDTDSLLWMLAPAPIVITIASAAVVYDLGLTLGLTKARSTVASLVFILTNWIGQDYFAPQAVAFLIVFVIVDLVLRNLSEAPPSLRRLSQWAGANDPPPRRYSGWEKTTTTLTIVALSAALIVSHQLSPVMLICILGALVALQRAASWRLTFIITLAFLGWVSYTAEAYWIGHSDVLFGSVGNVSSIASENLSDRSSTAGATRQLVIQLRLMTMLATWLAAGVSMLALRRQGRLDRAFVVVLFAPFVPLLLQPYGGEGLLRTALFSLPAASMMIASVDLSRPIVTRRARYAISAGLTVLIVLLAPLLMVTRYGNESYEAISDDDLIIYDAVGEILDQRDPSDAGQIRLFSFSGSGPALLGRMEFYSSFETLPRRPGTAAEILGDDLRSGTDVYIFLPAAQLIERQQVDGLVRGWQDDYLDRLGRLVSLEEVASTDHGSVFRVRSLRDDANR